MGTAVVVRDDARAIERVEDRAATALAPMSFEQIVHMGDQLVRTGFLPDHIKTGAQAAAIILTGQEMGMKPMRAIRSLQMVKGKVVESADSQLARFKADGGHAAFRRLDETGAVLFLRHPNGDEHEETFTVEDARKAGLLGKDMYGKFLKAMLRSRAITAGLKSVGWEGGVGNYDPSEAVAFSAPASGGSAPSHAEPAADEVVDEAMTIETARAMPLPGGPKAFNGKGGTPLGQLDPKMLTSIRKWVDTKITEAEADGEAPPIHYRLRNACDVILKMRAAEADQQQTKMPLDGTAPDPAAAADTSLKPGKVEDALDQPEPKDQSFGSLAGTAAVLLKDPRLDENDRKMLRAKFDETSTVDAMQALIAEIEKRLDLPF